jgi:IS30 family transposase
LGEMKRPRKSRGAPPKNTARAHYDQLMKQGVGNSEACRIVGISRSSGTRWRYGHSVVLKSGDIKKYAPISHRRPVVISARFLSESERITIADLLHARRSIRAIAREIGRSPSTVSREIRRNTHEPSGNYRPRTAQRSAERRRCRQRIGKIAENPELREFVREHLKQRWSPRQISNRLRADFPGQPEMHVVPETVYQALYGRGNLDLAVDPAVSLSQRTDRPPAAPPKGAPDQTIPGHGHDPGQARGSDRQISTRALGGRSNNWEGRSLGHRHTGRTNHALHHPRALGREPWC